MGSWRRREDWVGAQVEDQYVMINLDVGTYVALNATALEAWHLLAEPQDEEGLVAGLIARFRVEPEQCRRSVAALLETMRAQQLVERIG